MSERVVGTVISWDRRGFGFARTADGTTIYLGYPELTRAGIKRLDVGQRVCFETRGATVRRAPWADNIRVLDHA